MAEQVISVFSGVKGFLDNLSLEKIKDFEKGLIEKIKSEKSEILETIQSTGKLEDDVEQKLIEIIKEYKESMNNA